MKIGNSFIEFQRNGSSWTLNAVQEVHLKVAEYRPLRGSSLIPTPQQLVKKMAIVNVRYAEDMCFVYSVLAGLFPAEDHPSRVSHYINDIDLLNFDGTSFPIKLCDVKNMEKLNEISVNVFGYEQSEVYPIHITPFRFARHVNLMLLSCGER